MPPSYRALEAKVPTDLIADTFSIKPKSFNDVLTEQEALKARELANQLTQINAQTKQQEFDQEQALRDSIKTQFSGMEEVDPNSVMQAVKRAAAQQGDYQTLIDVEKAQRERRASSTPYTPEQIAALESASPGIKIPVGSDPNFLRDLSSIRRQDYYGQQVQQGQVRLDDKMSGRQIPEFGDARTDKDAVEFKETLVGANVVNRLVDELDASLAADGNALTGAESVKQRGLVSALAETLKGPAFANLGAALSATELGMLRSQLPILLADPGTSIGSALVEMGFGRDPRDALANLRNKISMVVEEEAKVRIKDYAGRRASSPPSLDPAALDAAIQRGGGGQQQVPGVGGVFNNEKVLSVKRIK